MRDHPSNLERHYKALSSEIVKMYEAVITLLDKLMLYFDKNWCKSASRKAELDLVCLMYRSQTAGLDDRSTQGRMGRPQS